MLKKTSYNQFVRMASESDHVVLYREIDGDMITPIQALLSKRDNRPIGFIEFKPTEEQSYAFLGFEPFAAFEAYGEDVAITIKKQRQLIKKNPFDALREFRKKFNIAGNHPLTRLTGGAIGFLSYDAVRTIENISTQHNNQDDIPDIALVIYKNGIYFDRINQTAAISTIQTVSNDPEQDYSNGMNHLNHLYDSLYHQAKGSELNQNHKTSETFTTDLNDDAYAKMVNKAKAYIRNGDVFQVVLSRSYSKSFFSDPIKLYRVLKKTSPTPYHFYIQHNDLTLIGASPEKIADINNNKILITPIAGTYPRNQESNESIVIDQLLNDPKEDAEHMMLVDLARNDIGAVSIPGSVNVTRLKYMAPFSHVYHICSDIEGDLDTTFDVIDMIKSTFPAGTLSGAPKIRAMEIIDELENSQRGTYGGGIIVLDRFDNLETCITIRTALIKNNKITIRSGGGIVHDSDPYKEAQEAKHKAQGLITAIEITEKGDEL